MKQTRLFMMVGLYFKSAEKTKIIVFLFAELETQSNIYIKTLSWNRFRQHLRNPCFPFKNLADVTCFQILLLPLCFGLFIFYNFYLFISHIFVLFYSSLKQPYLYCFLFPSPPSQLLHYSFSVYFPPDTHIFSLYNSLFILGLNISPSSSLSLSFCNLYHITLSLPHF